MRLRISVPCATYDHFSFRPKTASASSPKAAIPDFKAVPALLMLVESPSLKGVSGKYFNSNGKQVRSGSDATDERLQSKLWNLSEELCGEYLH